MKARKAMAMLGFALLLLGLAFFNTKSARAYYSLFTNSNSGGWSIGGNTVSISGSQPSGTITRVEISLRPHLGTGSGNVNLYLDSSRCASTNTVNVNATTTYDFFFSGCTLPIGNLQLGTNQTLVDFLSTAPDDYSGAISKPGNFTLYGGSIDQVDFSTRIDASSTPDFANWSVNWATASTTVPYFTVNYGNPSSTLANWDSQYHDTSYPGVASPGQDILPGASGEFPKSQPLAPGNYTAQILMYDQPTRTLLASSSPMNFNVATGSQVSAIGSTSPPENPAVNIDACANVSFTLVGVDFGYNFCRVMVFLFIPSDSSTGKFLTLWDTLKTKPPFGYFTESNTQLSSFSTSTPATVSLVALGGIYSFVHPIDLGLSFLVVMAFVFFIYHRLRKFDI